MKTRAFLIIVLFTLSVGAFGQAGQGQMHQRFPAAADVLRVGLTGATSGNVIDLPAAGIYNVCWIYQITRAASVSSSLLTTIGWNNGASKTTASFSLNGGALQLTADISNGLNSTGGNCVMIFSVAGQPITYSTAYASVGGTTMEYALYVTAERYQ